MSSELNVAGPRKSARKPTTALVLVILEDCITADEKEGAFRGDMLTADNQESKDAPNSSSLAAVCCLQFRPHVRY